MTAGFHDYTVYTFTVILNTAFAERLRNGQESAYDAVFGCCLDTILFFFVVIASLSLLSEIAAHHNHDRIACFQ